MILSRECEYGLEGLMVLARRPPGTVMLLQEIAEARRLPAGFLARIFQKLRRHDLVASHRGAIRGYALARPPGEIRVCEVFEALEGPDPFGKCIFWPRRCDDREPCSLHTSWVPISGALTGVMEGTSLAQVASRGRSGGAGQPRPPSRRVGSSGSR